MIVKNEEKNLKRCLDSVYDLVDEINIVDTGSTDKTVELAKKYTNRVYHFDWTGKFKDARNQSFLYATKDYVLYLDADDVLFEKDRQAFKKLKATLDFQVDAVSMYYDAGFDEYGNVTLRFRRHRLLKRKKQFVWKGDAHNYIEVSGNIQHANIAVSHVKKNHATGRTIRIYEQKLKNGEQFTPRDHFYYGNELRENSKYDKAIASYTQAIHCKDAWIEDRIFACLFRADCYQKLNQEKAVIQSLFQSLEISENPRPETFVRIGDYFIREGNHLAAVPWYKLALNSKHDERRLGFSYLFYTSWYAHLQLCICYYNLQEFDKANIHNELALVFRPKDELLLFHRKLLERLRTQR